MTRKGFIQFTIWAMQQREQGKRLAVPDVMTRFEVCRATAYRLIGNYFEAHGWEWPRPREVSFPVFKPEGGKHPWKQDSISRKAVSA